MSEFYSPWFPPGVQPVRPGSYLTSYKRNRNHIVLCHWNGQNWYDTSGEESEYTLIGGGEATPGHQPYYWCGLAATPKSTEGGT